MINFAIYEKRTGNIIHAGSALNLEHAAAGAGPNEVTIDTGAVHTTFATHWVNSKGELVAYTEEQRFIRSHIPSFWPHEWSNQMMSYLDLRSTEDQRTFLLSAVRGKAALIQAAGVSYNGKQFHADQSSLALLQSFLHLPEVPPITTVDNSVALLDHAELEDLIATIALFLNDLHQRVQAFRSGLQSMSLEQARDFVQDF